LRNSFILLLLLLSGIFSFTKGQTIDTTIDVIGVGSSSERTPFWIESNRFGQFASGGNQFLTRFQAHGRRAPNRFGPLELSYGADLIARPGSQSTLYFNQAYLKIQAYVFELYGGRFHNRSPVNDEQLSMGSLGVSGNAVPIPQVRIGIPEWTGIPLTNNFIQIRAHLAHGWLEEDRFTKRPFYQEKVGHLRFGGDFPLNIYGGLAHYAVWGGKSNPRYGDLPAKFSDFFRVFMGLAGDERAPNTEAIHLLGDHLGAWDFGLFFELNDVSIKVYRQLPYGDKNNLKLKNPQDALNGLSIRFEESLNLPIKGLTYEYLYSKWQDGPNRDKFNGDENYYNHGIYRSGWATYGRTIGNPLFRTSNIPIDMLGNGIDNNRIVAHHLGLEMAVNAIQIIGKLTVSRNFGTRNDPFKSPYNQLSMGILSQSSIAVFNQPITLLTDIALDSGKLFGNQVGAALGFRLSL